MDNMLNAWRPRVLSLLRIATGFLYIQHGTQKMFGFPVPQHNPFDLFSLFGAAGTLEVGGGGQWSIDNLRAGKAKGGNG
ncbi:MAG: hypothetical protein EPN61_04680 [Burkholderiaceae bacterium]|nr:MAG: hypothetical protein EPN61_04680 [Burkholderiaceae bacterium]